MPPDLAGQNIRCHWLYGDGTVEYRLLGKYGSFTSIHTTTTSANPWDVDYDPINDRLYVVPGASTASGATAASVTISGAATLLGNPVDVAYGGTNLYVAEKTQNVVMRFDNIRTSPGGNIPPSQQITVEIPSL